MKNCQEFLALQVPALKTLVFGNLFKLFRLRHHIRTGSLPLGNKDENRLILLVIPNSKLPLRM